MDTVQRRFSVLQSHLNLASNVASRANIEISDAAASSAPIDVLAIRLFLDGHNVEVRDEVQRLLVEDPLFQVSPKFHNSQKEVQRQLTDLRYLQSSTLS